MRVCAAAQVSIKLAPYASDDAKISKVRHTDSRRLSSARRRTLRRHASAARGLRTDHEEAADVFLFSISL